MGGDIVVGFIDAKFRAAFIRTLTVDGIVSLGYYTCLYVLYLSLDRECSVIWICQSNPRLYACPTSPTLLELLISCQSIKSMLYTRDQTLGDRYQRM